MTREEYRMKLYCDVYMKECGAMSSPNLYASEAVYAFDGIFPEGEIKDEVMTKREAIEFLKDRGLLK